MSGHRAAQTDFDVVGMRPEHHEIYWHVAL
jgi:hypothetical protein